MSLQRLFVKSFCCCCALTCRLCRRRVCMLYRPVECVRMFQLLFRGSAVEGARNIWRQFFSLNMIFQFSWSSLHMLYPIKLSHFYAQHIFLNVKCSECSGTPCFEQHLSVCSMSTLFSAAGQTLDNHQRIHSITASTTIRRHATVHDDPHPCLGEEQAIEEFCGHHWEFRIGLKLQCLGQKS